MLNVVGRVFLGLILFTAFASMAAAEGSPDETEFRSLDEQVQGLKGEVISINRELMLLQEKLIFPSNTQVSVFVSLQASRKFSLDSIELKLDNRTVEKHIYTFRELEALHKKGVQRLHTGNVPVGKHHLAVSIAGRTSSNHSYQHKQVFEFAKAAGPKLVELTVLDGGSSPTIKLTNWK